MIYVIIVALIALSDRASKTLIEQKFNEGDSQKIIENVLYLSRGKNTGMAFGKFQNGGVLLVLASSILIIILIYMIFTYKKHIGRIGFSCILGGALGNLYDRVFLKGVTDFIDIPPLSFIFPNFNVADSFIVIGTVLTAIYLLFISDLHKKNNENYNRQGAVSTGIEVKDVDVEAGNVSGDVEDRNGDGYMEAGNVSGDMEVGNVDGDIKIANTKDHINGK